MSWLQLELETHQDQAEGLSKLLEQSGAVSVTLTASSDEPVVDTGGQSDNESKKLWNKMRFIGLLHSVCLWPMP